MARNPPATTITFNGWTATLTNLSEELLEFIKEQRATIRLISNNSAHGQFNHYKANVSCDGSLNPSRTILVSQGVIDNTLRSTDDAKFDYLGIDNYDGLHANFIHGEKKFKPFKEGKKSRRLLFKFYEETNQLVSTDTDGNPFGTLHDIDETSLPFKDGLLEESDSTNSDIEDTGQKPKPSKEDMIQQAIDDERPVHKAREKEKHDQITNKPAKSAPPQKAKPK